ncbi:MAG: ferritin family protein [Bacteroidetes bacterium]|nr:ferritin family protein [Bacteroidota bacterium]MBU1717762.1 ferritin family protein [Bacteroidota bacterium]
MKEFVNTNDILDFAIGNEQDAVDFYLTLASEASSEGMRKAFEEIAGEEIKHKARLVEIKERGIFNMPVEKVADLKIGDYLVSDPVHAGMSYQQALIVAMKREKAAFKLYSALAEKAPNADLKSIFMALAVEESKHKLRFELEYDEHVLSEN